MQRRDFLKTKVYKRSYSDYDEPSTKTVKKTVSFSDQLTQDIPTPAFDENCDETNSTSPLVISSKIVPLLRRLPYRLRFHQLLYRARSLVLVYRLQAIRFWCHHPKQIASPIISKKHQEQSFLHRANQKFQSRKMTKTNHKFFFKL